MQRRNIPFNWVFILGIFFLASVFLLTNVGVGYLPLGQIGYAIAPSVVINQKDNALNLLSSLQRTPIIAYPAGWIAAGTTPAVVKFIHCGDQKCAANNVVQSFPSTLFTKAVSVIWGSDGLPMIANFVKYYGVFGIKCLDPNCSTSTNPNLLYPDVVDSSISYTSLVMKNHYGGVPFYLYRNYFYAVAVKCITPSCTNAVYNVLNFGSTSSTIGIAFDMAIQLASTPNARPIIVDVPFPFPMAPRKLVVRKCVDASCLNPPIVTVLDNDVGSSPADPYPQSGPKMVLDPEDVPAIVFRDSVSGNIVVYGCLDFDCTQFNSVILPYAGRQISAAFAADSSLVISYQKPVGLNGLPELRFIRCADVTCNTITTEKRVDAGTDTGYHSKTVMGIDSKPLIVYYAIRGTATVLKALKCRDMDCTAQTVTVLDPNTNLPPSELATNFVFSPPSVDV